MKIITIINLFHMLIIIGGVLFAGCTADYLTDVTSEIESTPLPLDPIEVELKKLAPGHILFNTPKEMILGVTEKVEIRIARNLTENLSKNLEGRGEPQFANISRVGTIMEVSLKGKNFDIELIGGEKKVVSGEDFTEWIYYVTPLKESNQYLSLIVNVIITLPNGEEVKTETVFEKIIDVKVYPIEDELKKFESKLILFEPPEEMTLGTEEIVEINIAKNITEDLFKRPAEVPQYSTIEIKQKMIGSNFDINPPASRKQVIPGEGFDKWIYLVTPSKSGNQSLSLVVDVNLILPNGEVKNYPSEFKKNINVKANIIYLIQFFIETNWKFIVNTIVTLLIAFGVIAWRKSKKSKKKEEAE